MTIGGSTALGVAVLMATAVAVQAQPAAYPPYTGYPPSAYYHVPAVPPGWNYDPYTSGLGPCPNWTPGDLPCRERIQPSFGQPSYRPVR
jgi:hypothetical protein